VALTAGHIVRGDTVAAGEAVPSAPVIRPGPSPAQARRVAREAADGHLEAAAVVARANERAGVILAHAEATVAEAAAKGAREAREREAAKLAAAWLALHAREERAAERDLDRAVTMAAALAERLLGTSLALDPTKITLLAKQALAEARGARRAVVEAHPEDAATLARDVSELGFPADAIEVRPNAALARGDLALHTDLGTLDAKLPARLDHLAAALRDALR
jgi:flagellar biosynthesis/type III secretory pathway protein FliH